MAYQGVRRKVFLAYHHSNQREVEDFVTRWCNTEKVFIPKVLGATGIDDLINSSNPEYVMSQIRTRYLGDSTVTIALIGKCTHSRRYVDWEIKASLRRTQSEPPNGLIGILLPSQGNKAHLPERLKSNWEVGEANCYARYRSAPTSPDQLAGWIEDAYDARTSRVSLIQNSQDMFKYNAKCLVCQVTH